MAGTVPFILASSSNTRSGSGTPRGSSSGSGSSSSSGAALTASAPGITPTTITIGSHQPLTGSAAPGYDEIAPASAAYFAYLNAHGGVYGRRSSTGTRTTPTTRTTTASVVRQLVLQDNVYAIFNGLGTATHLAAVSFLNAEKVPDVFVASGCECWDQPTSYPETFGYQLDYVREGKILGQYVAQHFKGKKVGYFYEDDEFGMDGVKGLSYEIPASMVVSRQGYLPTNVNIAAQVAALRTSGAQVVVAFSIPAFTALLKLYSLKLGFSPTLVVSNVGSAPMTLAGQFEAFAKQGGATVNGSQLTFGIITDSYLPALSTSDSWYVLFKKIHDQYDAGEPLDGNSFYGMAVAYTFTQAMFKAGRNPTRADLVSAIEAGLPQGPVVAPFAYSSTDHSGVTGAYIGVIQNGVIVQEGPVLTTDTSATGPISTYTGTEQSPQPAASPHPDTGSANYGERHRCWRGHLHRVHRVRRQPGHQPSARLKKQQMRWTPSRRPRCLLQVLPRPRPQRPARQRLSPLIPRPQPSARGVSSPTLSRSRRFRRSERCPVASLVDFLVDGQLFPVLQLVHGYPHGARVECGSLFGDRPAVRAIQEHHCPVVHARDSYRRLARQRRRVDDRRGKRCAGDPGQRAEGFGRLSARHRCPGLTASRTLGRSKGPA